MQERENLGDSISLPPRVAASGALALLVACSIDPRTVGVGSEDGGAAGTTGRAAEPRTMLSDPAATLSNGTSGASASGPTTPAQDCRGAACADAAASPASPVRVGGCTDGAQRCVGGAPEACSGGAWVPGAACADPLPFCLAATGLCVSCEAGSKRCTGQRVESCGDDGAWASLGIPCTECVPGTSDCIVDTARMCSALGAWVGQTCGGTTPTCVPQTGSCACTATSCAARELCAVSGRCEPLGPDCPTPQPVGVSDQDLGIVRVRFDADGSADVLMQNLGGGLVSFAAQGYQLCNGSSNCVFLSDDQSVTLVGDDSFSRRIPNTLPNGGELAVVFVSPGNPTSTEAYVAWGAGAGAASLEPIVDDTLPLWRTGDRIGVTSGDTGFVSIGDTSRARGYVSCNP